METGFTIRPRVTKVKTPTGGAESVAQATFEMLLSMRDEVRASVVDKMRRGASPADVSEQASVAAAVTGGQKPSLRVYSYSVRAAVDEGGRAPVGIPPFGKTSALAAWCELVLGTSVFHRVRGLAFAIARRGQPGPGDRLNQPFRRTQLEFNPVIRERMKQVRAEAVGRINAAG